VQAEVIETCGKPALEVARYLDVFLARCGEVKDYRAVQDRVEKAELRSAHRSATELIVAERVSRSADPLRTMQVPYGAAKTALAKGFTEDEDRLLIVLLNQLGYGAWDEMRAEIRRSESCRFDFFLKSRTPLELSKRCDALIRLLEADAKAKGTLSGREAHEARARAQRSAGEKPKNKKARLAEPVAAGAGAGAGAEEAMQGQGGGGGAAAAAAPGAATPAAADAALEIVE
jgi:SWI/SNF-related matrix-associated actin-dependent regulator of chromatin subfamily A member 5